MYLWQWLGARVLCHDMEEKLMRNFRTPHLQIVKLLGPSTCCWDPSRGSWPDSAMLRNVWLSAFLTSLLTIHSFWISCSNRSDRQISKREQQSQTRKVRDACNCDATRFSRKYPHRHHAKFRIMSKVEKEHEICPWGRVLLFIRHRVHSESQALPGWDDCLILQLCVDSGRPLSNRITAICISWACLETLQKAPYGRHNTGQCKFQGCFLTTVAAW